MAKHKKGKYSRSLQVVQTYFPKVSKVTDADGPVQVEVTDADNKSSQVRNHNACAMAVACKRKFKADGVIIAIATAYIIKGNEATRYTLPDSVSREVVSFDRKAGFMPGEYQLVPHGKSSRIGYQREPQNEKTDNRNPDGGLKRRFKFRHFTEGVRAALGSKRAPDGIVRSQ